MAFLIASTRCCVSTGLDAMSPRIPSSNCSNPAPVVLERSPNSSVIGSTMSPINRCASKLPTPIPLLPIAASAAACPLVSAASPFPDILANAASYLP